jgi:hypothetical protein
LHRERRDREITFADACTFWGQPDEAGRGALRVVLDGIGETLLRKGDAVLKDGRAVTAKDVALLWAIHTDMETKFRKHLRLMQEKE